MCTGTTWSCSYTDAYTRTVLLQYADRIHQRSPAQVEPVEQYNRVRTNQFPLLFERVKIEECPCMGPLLAKRACSQPPRQPLRSFPAGPKFPSSNGHRVSSWTRQPARPLHKALCSDLDLPQPTVHASSFASSFPGGRPPAIFVGGCKPRPSNLPACQPANLPTCQPTTATPHRALSPLSSPFVSHLVNGLFCYVSETHI